MLEDHICCSLEQFYNSYGLFKPTRGVVNQILKKLTTTTSLNIVQGALHRSVPKEVDCWLPLKRIYEAVDEIQIPGRSRNANVFRLIPNNNKMLHESLHLRDRNLRAFGCFTSRSRGSTSPLDIVVPWELRPMSSVNDHDSNRKQLARHALSILNTDARRKLLFAVTIEDEELSLWYISRSHSARANSFNWTTNPQMLVRVLISLMYSTPEELGMDPLVHLAPSKSPEPRFIYEVPESTGPRTRAAKRRRFYRTTGCISPPPEVITGRTSRIWRVIEVASVENPVPKLGAQEKVLKDAWVKADSLTEGDIQRRLFDDIASFARSDWRSNPAFQPFVEDEATDKSFTTLLEGGRFKDLFLCVALEHAGSASFAIPEPSWMAPQSSLGKRQRMWDEAKPTVPEDGAQMRRKANRQHFPCLKRNVVIFEDICCRVDHLPTLGEAFDILEQCVTALRLMFCAGWVHRDVSPGNILAFRTAPDAAWQLRLADLEFAQPFPPANASQRFEGPLGTPFFTACEILKGGLLRYPPPQYTRRLCRDSDSEDDGSSDHSDDEPLCRFLHNWQHDLESVYWICIWLITSRVNNDYSEACAERLFPDSLTFSRERSEFFEYKSYKQLRSWLDQRLKPLARPLEQARCDMVYEYYCRAEKRLAEDPASYVPIHITMSQLFSRFPRDGEWKSVTLQRTSALPPSSQTCSMTLPQHAIVPASLVQKPTGGTVGLKRPRNSRDDDRPNGANPTQRRSVRRKPNAQS